MARLAGWNLVWLTTIVIGAFSAARFARVGADEESVRLLIRATARSSFGLFLLAFCASSLRSLVRQDWSAWLLRNRRYLGVSFAVSHTYHLAFIFTLATLYPQPFLGGLFWPIQMLNALTYLFIFAMAATSTDAMQKRLGVNRWHRLHQLGSYLIFAIFLGSYLPRAVENAAYLPCVILLSVAAGLRLTRSMRARSAQLT